MAHFCAIVRCIRLPRELHLAGDLTQERVGEDQQQGDGDAVFDAPQTEYTKTLMAAAFSLRAG